MSGNVFRCAFFWLVMLVFGTTVVFGNSNIPLIKKLTSKKTAKNVEKEIQKVFRRPVVDREDGLNVHSFGLGLGQTFVKGDFEYLGADKITLDFLYNYTVSYSFDLLLNVHYSQHSFSKTFVRLQGAVVGIKAKLYQFDSFYPYVLGGFGFYSPKVRRRGKSTDPHLESKSRLVFGTHMGAGGDLKLNRHFSFGIVGHYHNPFDVRQEFGPEVEGSYLKLLTTLSYHF